MYFERVYLCAEVRLRVEEGLHAVVIVLREFSLEKNRKTCIVEGLDLVVEGVDLVVEALKGIDSMRKHDKTPMEED